MLFAGNLFYQIVLIFNDFFEVIFQSFHLNEISQQSLLPLPALGKTWHRLALLLR